MDYDEDIVFSLDFKLVPGTYDPDKQQSAPQSSRKGWHALSRSS
jgi:hypothetical protein